MSDIEWCKNYVASSFQSTDNFLYTLQSSTDDKPDAMIIRQINASILTATIQNGILAFDLFCNVSNTIIGSLIFPVLTTAAAGNDSSMISFTSNPQTYIQLTKPVPSNIRFQLVLPPNADATNNALPATYFISISFDLVKYKNKK